MSYGSPRQQYRVCRDKKLSSFQRRLALTGRTGGGKKIQNATAHVSSTMCSHRKQILCWDSSWPSITIIPARWLWQSWPWFDSLTCCCMGHKLSKSLWHRGSKPRNVSLLKASVSGRVGDTCQDQYEMGDILIIISASDTEFSVIFKLNVHTAAA